MKMVLDGADGFLGWHTTVRVKAMTQHEVLPVTLANRHSFEDLGRHTDALLHVARVNDVTIATEVENSSWRRTTGWPSERLGDPCEPRSLPVVIDLPAMMGGSGADGPDAAVVPEAYRVANTSDGVVRFILSTARRHRQWSGLR